ncbi:flagellar basal body P-ring formation chaperone FlgA [Helicobacter sp. 11S02629-2]|uniref:flagellar basal body P-ring formation chaperone FlgA n=1 Tax=Helicobacter sp. 11S02629-2 TaxID=1476195 RepID=UPI000BA7DCA6|nr:flagellar basal body P-ring formation chaperone FlgA [Helicobacter sp. 11S02629-2]PAF41795.1 flagella basal body P-ring formation protein FlgA [Helicobacter sp. 11S02629-2]
MLRYLFLSLSFLCFLLASPSSHSTKLTNIESIKQYIKNDYLNKYQNLRVKEVTFSARSSLDIEHIKILNMKLLSLKSNTGYLRLKYSYKNAILEDSLSYTLSATVQAFKAKRDIGMNENLTSDLLSEVDIPFSKGGLASKGLILSSASKVAMQKDTIILDRMLKPAILVRMNELVSAKTSVGGVVVESTFRALQNGAMGDMIKLRTLDSNKILQGVVTGENLVEIR